MEKIDENYGVFIQFVEFDKEKVSIMLRIPASYVCKDNVIGEYSIKTERKILKLKDRQVSRDVVFAYLVSPSKEEYQNNKDVKDKFVKCFEKLKESLRKDYPRLPVYLINFDGKIYNC